MPKLTRASPGARTQTRKRGTGSGRARAGSSTRSLLLGFLIGVCFAVAGVAAYFYLGHPPVAVADKPALWEHLSQSTAVHRRIAAEAKQPPFPAGEDVFEAAARTYRAECAVCHGVPGHESALGRQMLPHAQQFFGRDRRATSAQQVGELFWPTAFGIRRSGMPAYNRTLSNTQLWQLALLLHSANDELPDPVVHLLQSAPAVPVAAGGSSATVRMPDKSHLAPSERPESRF